MRHNFRQPAVVTALAKFFVMLSRLTTRIPPYTSVVPADHTQEGLPLEKVRIMNISSSGVEASPSTGDGQEKGNAAANDGIVAPGMTGRYLVLLREDAIQEGIQALSDTVGLTVANAADFENGAIGAEAVAGTAGVVFDRIGVAVVDSPPEQIMRLSAAAADSSSPILAVEPERIVYAIQENGPPHSGAAGESSVEYYKGYRDAVNFLVEKMLKDNGLSDEITAAAVVDESVLTWGLQATKAAVSQFTGRGIRVAVLDTGLDLGHPDFAGRPIVSQSFVQGQAVQDGHGHGTHCIGTSCGPKRPGTLPRYGIAYEAEIYAGKVLSNQGSGADSSILAGINWAVTSGCHIISMSLGSRVLPGDTFSQVYEQVAQRALAAGTLIICAAGNESHRPNDIALVSRPANCPSIMAVAALDAPLRIASFSCGGINPQGGEVNIAGPGVAVRSTWPRPVLYNTISGTSMATPHVAGIAALHAQAHPNARGLALATLLMQTARRLALPARDVGAGLVQAP